jgi:hypothetical protein
MSLPDLSGIKSIINSGNAFSNPISGKVNSALQGFTPPSVAELMGIAEVQFAAKNLPVPDYNEIAAAQNSVVNAYNKIQDMLHHTNKLSGVNMSGNGTLATIAKTMSSARNASGAKSCDKVLAAFGSIRDAANTINDCVTTIDLAKRMLKDLPGHIKTIPKQLDSQADKIVKKILHETAAIANAQIENAKHALSMQMAEMFQDECVGQVLGAVMTKDMNLQVKKVTDEIAKKRVSMFQKIMK